VEQGTVTGAIVRGRVVEPIGEARYAEQAEMELELLTFATEARERAGVRRASLVLGASLLQKRMLTELPNVNGAVLRELIQAQQKRFFRRNGRPLVTDARWEANTLGGGRHVSAVAVDEGVVVSAIGAIARAGLSIGSVSDETGQLRLLPSGAIAVQRGRMWRQTRGIAYTTVALCIGTGVASWVRLRSVERALDARLAQLAPASVSIREARRRLAEAEGLVSAVDAADEGGGAMRQRLARVLLSLPDSAYLTSLTLDQSGSASLSGTAEETSAVVAQLERNGGLSNVRVEGTPLIDGSVGRRWERFSIQAGRAQAMGAP
jgi:hypothetical protein